MLAAVAPSGVGGGDSARVQFSAGGRHGDIVPVSRFSMFPSMHEYSMIVVPHGSIGHVLASVNGLV